MKKSVAIIVSVIYVLSIVFIAFFGMQLSTWYDEIYVKSIQFTNEGITTLENGTKRILLKYQQGMVYKLDWEILPADATNRVVSFAYKANDGILVTAFGDIVFYAPVSITITIRATDGSNASDTIQILLY